MNKKTNIKKPFWNIYTLGILVIILFIIIFTIPFFNGETFYGKFKISMEKEYCQENPKDCECVEFDDMLACSNDNDERCPPEGNGYFCNKYQKKSPCQLDLESYSGEIETWEYNNILADTMYEPYCICDEEETIYETKIVPNKSDIIDLREDFIVDKVNGVGIIGHGVFYIVEKEFCAESFMVEEYIEDSKDNRIIHNISRVVCSKEYGMKEIKVEKGKICIKAREKNECEKGNSEYILNICNRGEKTINEMRLCLYDCPLNESEECSMPMTHTGYKYNCRKKNECEKNNPEYILSCYEGIEGFELVDGECEKCTTSDYLPKVRTCAVKEPICNKKTIYDLTCEELLELEIKVNNIDFTFINSYSEKRYCLIENKYLKGILKIGKLCFTGKEINNRYEELECTKENFPELININFNPIWNPPVSEVIPSNYIQVKIFEEVCVSEPCQVFCNMSYPPQCNSCPTHCYNKSRIIWMPKGT